MTLQLDNKAYALTVSYSESKRHTLTMQ